MKPLSRSEIDASLNGLPGWSLRGKLIEKEFLFKSFLAGLEFAYVLGKIAEGENHHPDILVRWRRVKVMLSTHTVKGLTVNDFIMAAKSELEFSKIIATKNY